MKIFLLPVCRGHRAGLTLVLFTLFFARASAQAPSNDECTGAVSLVSATTCTATSGTVVSATQSSGLQAGCSGSAYYDVWYSFVAATANPTITLSGLGSNFTSPGVMLFKGLCPALTAIGCASGKSLTASGLTVGSTYYIRVYSNSSLSSKGGFSICVTDPAPGVVDYGKSYVNINKGSNGGTIEPKDTLEIRLTFVVKSGTAYGCSFSDAVPSNTHYVPGSLRILTNEGKVYQQWTDSLDGDPAHISGSAITINLGSGADSVNGGSVSHTSRPSFFKNNCIMVASYQVVVDSTLAFGTLINVGGGSLTYAQNQGTASTVVQFPTVNAVVYKNLGICSNTVGANAILSEYGGSFGSGNVKDRAASAKIPANYTYATFNSTTGMPNDYYYGISNNTSGGTTLATGYSTVNTWAKPDASSPTHRIFGVWDIIGDHTGASNPLLGNPPTDDNAGASGGYMAVINAAYKTDTAFLDTVYNLCPNTYYQYSAWFRNLCSRCGCDSTGSGPSSSGYIPTGPGDSSGVHPNLTFNVNGNDYYTTGNIPYTGQWIQKGLTYLTGPAQTSMVIHIRNNAPGGGGNDWAIDDITVATCVPDIALTPNKPDTLCQGADDTVRFKVSSYFNNYTEWLLQKSLDGGLSWSAAGTDTTGASSTGSTTPVYNASTKQYEYTVTRYYRLGVSDTLTTYRLTVASTVANLSLSSCTTTNSAHKLVLGVNCQSVLPTQLLRFRGQATDGYAALQWVSSGETGNIRFVVQRSEDQLHFRDIGQLPGSTQPGTGNDYYFRDPLPLARSTYYRISMLSGNYSKLSQVILLSNTDIPFELRAVTNPFTDWMSMDLTSPGDGPLVITLTDMFGRVISKSPRQVYSGLNTLRLNQMGRLSAGIYNLQVRYGDKTANRLLIRQVN